MKVKVLIAFSCMLASILILCHVVGIDMAINASVNKVKGDLQIADIRGQQFEVIDGISHITVRGSVEKSDGQVVRSEESRRIFLWWHWPE